MTAPGGAAPDGGRRQLLRLELTERGCALMTGSLDTSEMERSFQAGGLSLEIVEAKWTATLDQRDVALEQAVARFVSAPVPAKITWEYLDAVTAEFNRLRGSDPSDYVRLEGAARTAPRAQA